MEPGPALLNVLILLSANAVYTNTRSWMEAVLLNCVFCAFSRQSHLNHSIHSSLHSLDEDGPDSCDPCRDGLRRVQSTDSLGSSGNALQPQGLNHKAKSASNLDESEFGPLVGAEYNPSVTPSIGSLPFLLTKDQEKAIKAMTPEQEETASLLSSISQRLDATYLPPAGYRLVSDLEWNLLQQEVGGSK